MKGDGKLDSVSSTYAKEEQTYWKKGIVDGLPIAVGYMPVALTFGLIAGTTGLSSLESVLMSMIVFAGASQYMALSMIGLGTGAVEIILATFIVNFRHLLMSASIHERAEKSSKRIRALYAYFLTDEVFAVASTKEKPIRTGYIISVGIIAYLSWVIFTGIGYYAGSFLPEVLQKGMAIALFALFIALLVPSIKKEGRIVVVLASFGAIFHYIFQFFMSTGWAIMFGTIAAILLYEWIEYRVMKKRGRV